MTIRSHTPLVTLIAMIGLAALASGCAAQPAPARVDEPQTLTLFHIDGGPDLDPAVAWFVEAVAERSNGAIAIEVIRSCCGGDADVEEDLVASVAKGEADLGWVGTRVFAEMGVDSLSALTSPFVVDGYALQQAALTSPEVDEALGAVSRLEVTPLAVVPGSIRYPLAASAPVVSLEDWSSLKIASFHSAQNADALRALGADPIDVSFEERDAGIFAGSIEALENSLIMQDLGREATLPYATVDVGLWPRTSALIADPDSAAASGSVAEALAAAAADVVGRTGDLQQLDAAAMQTSCADGARFALAGEAELASIREAVQSQIDTVADDPDSGPLMRAILALAEEHVASVPQIPAGCDRAAPETAIEATSDPAVVNGRYQTVLFTEQQLLDAGFDPDDAKSAAGQFTLTFTDGVFGLTHQQGDQTFGCDGEYTIDANRVSIDYLPGGDCGPGGVFLTAAFAVDGRALTFSEIESAYPSDEYLFGSGPLTRVG